MMNSVSIDTENLTRLALIFTSMVAVYTVGKIFYNIFLHPLKSYPGPLLWQSTAICRSMAYLTGQLPFKVKELHDRYGPIVRIAPNELAYTNVEAWKEIYGHRTDGKPEFPKYMKQYTPMNEAHSIITADREEHSAIRRQMSHGFSDRKMKEQEPLITEYVNLLIQRLHENAGKGDTINLLKWYNFTTFDIISDLAFGVEGGFGCLQGSGYHPWVTLLTKAIESASHIQALVRMGLREPLRWFLKLGKDAESQNLARVKEKVLERIESGAQRPDFMESMLQKKGRSFTFDELVSNANILILAGSETTATLLCGVTYYLTMNPDKLAKLTQEVRSTFKDESEINFTTVNKLTYMLACLNEGFRKYPPVATGLPRVIPKGGAVISGKAVPEDTVVAVWQWSINQDPRYWSEPEKYEPERWLSDKAPADKDNLEAMQPFSVGPRNCIGRNLSYAEMRLILARVIFDFDMTIDEGCRDWHSIQKAYVVWHKPALNIHLTPVKR